MPTRTTSTLPRPPGPTTPARGRVGRWRAVLGTPGAVGFVAAGGAAVVVALRATVVGHGKIGTFVVAGSRFATHAGGYPKVPVIAGNGYDGQFYYRLALGPFDFAAHAFGVTLDTPARLERIIYPALSWALAGGRASLVPWSLVAVNVVGLGVLGWLGGILARDGGRYAAWGLLVPGYFGFVWSLSRDLTEITEVALLLGGLVALRRGRPLVAGFALAGAVLTRETAVVAVVCIAAVHLAQARARRHGRGIEGTGVRAVTWGIPLAVFVAWQGAIGATVGHVPVSTSGEHNIGLPFVGLARGAAHYASALPSHASVLWFTEIVVLATVVLAAGRRVGSSAALPHERATWAAYVVMTLCLSPGIWLGDVGFRSLDDVYALSCLVLLASGRRERWVAPLMALMWGVVAAQLVMVI